MHVRCSKCRGRQSLTRRPDEYVRLPRCRHCGRKMTAFPIRRTEPHYYVDRYRTMHEVGQGGRGRVCHPGRGGCNEYHFPHRRGSGWCLHNPNITEEQLKERER